MRVDLRRSGVEIARHHDQLCAAMGGRELHVARFDRSAHASDDLAVARAFWLARMEAEHRSVQVFAQLGGQLLEAGAPIDATTVMLRLAQDELRHTEICGAMVAALGGEPAFDADLTIRPLATHAGCSPAERALRNVLYATCLSEMVACARLVDALEHTTDETARACTRAVLADEILHGTFGFHYVETIGPLDDETRASVERYLVHAFAVLEREMASPPRGPRPSPGAMALGVIDPVRARVVFHGTIEQAVVPALERHGLGAARAWRDRRILG